MAIKWAVADGNWTATATWNDGTIPQVGDVVYCNGHVITLTGNVDLGTGEIRNDAYDAEGILGGGYLNTSAARTITANLFAGDVNILKIVGNYNISVYGNIEVVGNSVEVFDYSSNNQNCTITIEGDIHLNNAVFANRIRLKWNIVGNIYAEHGFMESVSTSYNLSKLITGNIYLGDNAVSLFGGCASGSTTTINGNIIGSSQSLFGDNIVNTCNINGDVNFPMANLCESYINSLTITGSLTQGVGKFATYINTFNLNGTLNLSGIKPFDSGVQTLNVASGSSITYDNHFYYCYNEINAIDADFEIVCRNQNLDNLSVINNNNLADTYPDEDKVANGVEYGYSGEYEGTMELIDESVVLAGYHYGNKTGTFAVQVPSALTTKLTEVLNKINDAYTRLGNMHTLQNTINDAIAELPSEQFIVETIGG